MVSLALISAATLTLRLRSPARKPDWPPVQNESDLFQTVRHLSPRPLEKPEKIQGSPKVTIAAILVATEAESLPVS
ncbi:hypothetical protein DL96DRAFT_699686 [Flagelloscypha sp. PMI_526]|nr:hypothetical protein DL96DRAFT_699686 [Flagelloscypha sp. PMI_526]